MKKIITIMAASAVVLAAVFGIKSLLKPDDVVMVDEVIDADKAKLNNWLGKMSIEDKVGQMIIMTNNEQSVTDEFRNELLGVKPGGYILMIPNITTYAQTKKMLEEIDRISRREYGINDLPMILAVDEEGGNVQRLLYVEDKDATNVPYMYSVGTTDDKELAYEIGKVIGEEVRSLGLNLTFAPSVDVVDDPDSGVIGRRSFGRDRDLVARMAISISEGINSIGIGTIYKHFPGHGGTVTDSHVELPVLNKSWNELENVELYPFRKAIGSGAEMIMVGHIALQNGGEPASLDYETVTTVLKEKMGFEGLVVTDALNMGAVANSYTGAEIAVMAVEAGEDILLMPANAEEAKAAILEAIESGEITEDRINESVRKILNYKIKHLSKFEPLGEEYFGSEEHKNIVRKVN